MKISILTEGNRKLGLGHVIRCISLYQAFEAEGMRVEIVVQGNSRVKEILAPFPHRMINWVNDQQLVEQVTKKAEIVIVDSRIVNKETCDNIAKAVNVPVFLDDTQRLTYFRGVVINRTVLSETKKYSQKKGLVYLLGAKYMPLTKAFWYAPIKNINKNITKVLLSFGGSDPKNVTPTVANYLLKSHPEYQLDVVIGNSFDEKKLNIPEGKNIVLHNNLSGEEMKNLMLEADLAISAGGQTLFELARIGVPTIAVQVVDNQTDNIDSLIRSKFLEFSGNYSNDKLLSNIENKLDFLASYERRLQRNKIGRSLIDGYGSVRIASFLLGAYRFSNTTKV